MIARHAPQAVSRPRRIVEAVKLLAQRELGRM